MTILHLAELQLIDFTLVDSDGIEVTGLGSGFTLQLSKNGAAFAAGTGVKAEIGSGWYKYQLTAAETDTEGPLAIKITGTGAVQRNLIYTVSGSIWEESPGPNILSSAEAAAFLRCDEDDPIMLLLLPEIDEYIKRGTGHDWAADSTVPQAAKSAARNLLVQWHEDPGMLTGSQATVLSGNFQACMSQLRAMAHYYFTFEGLPGAGMIQIAGVSEGDSVITLVGKVGISGDQSSKFESVITWDGYLVQTSSEDLEEKWFTAYMVPPGEMP
jgi:hypothetical protein